MASIAIFKTLGLDGKTKVFKRNNRLKHTHAYGILYRVKSSGKTVSIASWGCDVANAKLNLVKRIGNWNENQYCEILSEECVEVIL